MSCDRRLVSLFTAVRCRGLDVCAHHASFVHEGTKRRDRSSQRGQGLSPPVGNWSGWPLGLLFPALAHHGTGLGPKLRHDGSHRIPPRKRGPDGHLVGGQSRRGSHGRMDRGDLSIRCVVQRRSRGLTPQIGRGAEHGLMHVERWFAGAQPAWVYTCQTNHQFHYATLAFVAGLVACCVAAGVGYAARRLVAALRRRRGQCIRCGYDLTGNTTGVCPECGLIAATGWDVRELVWPGDSNERSTGRSP